MDTLNEEQFERMIEDLKINREPPAGHREELKVRVLAAFAESGKAARAARRPWPVRLKGLLTMRNLKRLAAAAILVAAAGIGVHFFLFGTHGRSGIAYADVRERIENAEGFTCLYMLSGQTPTPLQVEMMVLDATHARQTVGIGAETSINIIDMSAGKILNLVPEKKLATMISVKGLPDASNDQGLNFLGRLKKSMGKSAEDLGEKEIGGVKTRGFRTKNGLAVTTLWADVETALPVELESNMGMGGVVLVMKDFKFNQSLDRSLFALDVPKDYKLQENTMDLSNATEEDLVGALKMVAEGNSGVFPATLLDPRALAEMGAGFEKEGKTDQEIVTAMSVVARGLRFVSKYKNWEYVGNGVELGDADTAVLWYRPKDSATGRVIYGDLSVQDVPADEMPTTQPQGQPGGGTPGLPKPGQTSPPGPAE